MRDRVAQLVVDHQAATATPIIFEVLRGSRTLRAAETLRSRLASLHVLPFAEPDWSEATAWASRLARTGPIAKSINVLIAHSARKHGLMLLHADADFDRLAKIAHLKVESWVDRIRRKNS